MWNAHFSINTIQKRKKILRVIQKEKKGQPESYE